MRLQTYLMLLIYACLWLEANASNDKTIGLKSPDNRVKIEVSIADKITYSVHYDSKPVLLPSEISMRLQDGILPGNYAKLKKVKSNR